MTKLVVVGDFMSRKEWEKGEVWSDGNAWNFQQSLRKAGIALQDCFFTNVFNMPPPGAYTYESFFTDKKNGVPHLKPVKKGKYLHPAYYGELARLWKQINHHDPNLIIACGDVATWALCMGDNPIDSARGRICESNSAITGKKVLPVYDANVVRSNPAMGAIQTFDLHKAAREMNSKEFTRPQRFLHIEPTLDDLEEFYQQYIEPSPYLSTDIETKGDMITCVSFAPTPDRALVVPFFSEETPSGNYWPDKRSEYLAWVFVRRMLKLGKSVAGQNYQFDMQHELVSMGIPNPDATDDTMLLHHSLQPELKKGLGFLASIYTDEIQWKGMHHVSGTDKSVKKGDNE